MITEEQRQARKKGLGGSDIPAVCGISKWTTPIEVWMDKTNPEYQKQFDDDAIERMDWGNILEEAVAQETGKRLNGKVRKVNRTLQDKKFPFLMGHLDRTIEVNGEKKLLEIKTTNDRNLKSWQEDGVPEDYQLQVQHYLHLTGLKKAVIACLFGGQKMLMFDIERDDKVISYALDISVNFWQKYVTTKEMPPIDFNRDSEAIKTMFPSSNGNIIEVPEELECVMADYAQVNDQIKKLEDTKEVLGNQIKAFMGENEKAKGTSFIASWKSSTRENIDTKRLRAELPNVVQEYVRQVSSRSFTVKQIKGE